jgi:hypothetical protein
MRLDGKMRVQHEITVETDNGQHHIIPTDEVTVQKLIELHATGAMKATSTPLREPPATLMMGDIVPPWGGASPAWEGEETAQEEEDSEGEDPGEVVIRAVSIPTARAMPRPKFLEDEDGNQI